MHHLLIREVHHEVKNEMRFVVNDSRLRFGLGEFALVTGLKCKGDTSIESIAENRLILKYFGTASVTFAQLADCFKKKKWETDDDALKIAVLYFVNSFLLSQLKTKLKNITPTDDEKQLFDVRGLSFEIEVECTDSQPDSFQVFGTQLPKTQSMHESTGSDSQPTNAEVMKELQALKLFVENKFEEVLAAIGRQSMKPEGNSAHKQQDNDPDFREMHNDYDQFESGHVGNDPVVIGDSTPKAPSRGRCNVNQSENEPTTRAVNKSKPDKLVSRSIVQIQTDVETTPAVFTRRRRPAAVKQSPYRNDWQSGVTAVRGSSKVIKGRFPFVNDISETVDFKLTTAFSNFVEANMQLGEEVYLPGDQKLEPCFDFEVEQIDDKTFFHTLNYSGRPLSSSHLNIIFYYLRKKAKYGINMPIKVTTTDTLFNNSIQRVFTEFFKGGKQDHLIDRSDDIMQYMKGFRMHCNTLWHRVDHVFFPINLAESWHWILGCVSFHKRCFYVYDSLRSRKHKKAIQKVAEAYALLIPLFLVSIEFYNQRSDIVVENGLHMGKNLTDPFEIELITNLPTQQNSDCGVYVACFAEYIIEDLPIPVANFDVDGLRAMFGILLWHYGRNKQLHGESSESEAPVAPKKTRGKKRKK
ncbi:hypothetical protein A4A49_21204 [Nicotiana attenuata]|uniref:Ubiquitin-like protease family profile domain-containing protein n=1 Tax=Nicotiana attenuata TaxID=49451 RepID=A0A1J6IS05_NICAT|nr:hypothetical protein A4A49_21204 [Nicotiana attenuata]